MNVRKSYIIACIIALAACVFMVAFPSVALLSAQKGISLWASSVLPALLPFFICANFLNYMGITAVLKPSAFTFTMSVMSGYPMGAKIIGDMGRRKYISVAEAKRLLSFCSTSGPAFLVGAVGVGMLGSTAAGLIIAASHYGGALINGFIFTLINKKNRIVKVAGYRKVEEHKRTVVKKDLLELFTNAILDSFKSVGIILAYIIIFMFITDAIQFSGALNIVDAPFIKGIFKGMFEMTVGCASLSYCTDITMQWKCIFYTFLISFGGLSIIGQSMSMLSGLNISIFYFIWTKICHSFWSVFLAFIIFTFVV